MVSQIRLALLIGAITAVAVSPVGASFRAQRCCDNPCGPSTTAPAYRTVTCTEWVRENYTTTRTVYKVQCRQEYYDAVRCERVPVCKDVCVNVTKRVPVWTEQCRKVCHKVTCYEDRVVNKTCYKYVQETCMKKQLVRLGHWECREVCGLFGGGGGGLFSGHGHGGGCCDSGCGNNNCCQDSCRPARTRKVWVSCPEYRECPVTVCRKVAYCVPTTCKVAVCRNEWREEKCKVCTYQCVTEKCIKKVTCYETRQVAYKACRTVRVCVPCTETVTCCKMVPRQVCRQVPCAPACNTNSCGSSCGNSCGNDCCNTGGFFGRLRGGFGGGCGHSRDCCRPSCCN
jgi:hypothetical protein